MKTQLTILAFSFIFSTSALAQTPPIDPSRPAESPSSDIPGTITKDKNTVPVADPVTASPEPDTVGAVREFPRSLWGVYGGIGLPHGLNLGVEYIHASRFWSLGLDTGSFNAKLKDETNDKEEVASGSFGFEGRYHPWQAAFFVGAGLGAQRITAKKTASYLGQSVTPEVKVNNTYLTPKVGWLWQFNSGINFGVELGAQVPLSSKVDIENGTTNILILNDPDFVKNKQDVQDLAEKIGKQVFPHLVVRFGYAF